LDLQCHSGLSMFDQYDIDGLKHSSSEGQRVETQIHTINARHGSKYFGLKKGVSAYTLVAIPRTPTARDQGKSGAGS
jgi:hypothetical protein